MKNIYLIYGIEDYLINEYKNEIIKKINTENIICYDLEENTVSDIIFEANTLSLFDEKKIIVCNNCSFLTSNSKNNNEKDIENLIKYINNPLKEVYIIFIVNNLKLDERKKIVKELKKISKVLEAKKIENYDLNNYIKNYIEKNKYKITNSCINLLISQVGTNLNILINEINKIFIYKNNDKIITEEDIKGLCITNIEDNIFKLTNSFLSERKEETVKIYRDLLLIGIKHEAIIGTIASQLRLLLQVNLMKKNGYSDKEMVSILKEHPYRIKLAKENTFSSKKLKDKILELSYLDLDLKSNKINKDLGLELFLLNM